MAKPPSTGNSN